MAEPKSLERELGEIGQHLKSIDLKLESMDAQMKIANGRTGGLEKSTAILEQRMRSVEGDIEDQGKELKERRLRPWTVFLAVSGGLCSGLLAAAFAHGF